MWLCLLHNFHGASHPFLPILGHPHHHHALIILANGIIVATCFCHIVLRLLCPIATAPHGHWAHANTHRSTCCSSARAEPRLCLLRLVFAASFQVAYRGVERNLPLPFTPMVPVAVMVVGPTDAAPLRPWPWAGLHVPCIPTLTSAHEQHALPLGIAALRPLRRGPSACRLCMACTTTSHGVRRCHGEHMRTPACLHGLPLELVERHGGCRSCSCLCSSCLRSP